MNSVKGYFSKKYLDVLNQLYFKGQVQRKHKFLSYERASKMLKNDICITVIGQAVLEISHFKVDIPRRSPRTRTSLTLFIPGGGCFPPPGQ